MTSRRTCLVSDWNSLICGCVSVLMRFYCVYLGPAGIDQLPWGRRRGVQARSEPPSPGPSSRGPSCAGIEVQLALHAFVRLARLDGLRGRRDQPDDHQLIPVRACRHTAAAQPQLLAALRARRNGEFNGPAEGRYRHPGAECRLPGSEGQLDLHVLAIQLVQGMREHFDAKDKRGMCRASTDAQGLAVSDTRGDLHVHLARSTGLVDADAALRAREGFLDRDLDDTRIGVGLAPRGAGAARGRSTR